MFYYCIKCLLWLIHLTLVVLYVTEFSTAAVTLMPADYLLPPPPALPLAAPTVVRFNTNNQNSKKLLTPKYNEPPPGIINRVARWFGYANNGQNKWPDVISSADNSKQSAIYYDKQYGKRQTVDAATNKKNCNVCNKYPWMPMFHSSNQWTPQTYTTSTQSLRIEGGNTLVEPHHGTSKIKQRAVQYYGPQMNLLNTEQNMFKHPPYSPYNYESTKTANTITGSGISISPQTLYKSSPNETYNEHAEQTAQSSNNDNNVEIIKSKEVVEYLSSVEHPVTIVQSQAIDVNVSAHITLPSNHKFESNNNEEFYDNNQHHHTQQESFLLQNPLDVISETRSFINRIPSSDGGDVNVDFEEYYHSPSTASVYEDLTPSYKYLPQYSFEGDNLIAASSQNDSTIEDTLTATTTVRTSTTTEKVRITKSNDYHYTTIVSKINSSEDLKTQWLLGSLHDYGSREYRKHRLNNFLTNLQIPKSQRQQQQQLYQHQLIRQRETPKNLLSAPIQHISKGLMDIPRPFTKDPEKLGFHNKIKNNFRTVTTVKPNYSISHNIGSGNTMPQRYLSQTLPTPTSTYGALDASGYYASISPPPIPLSKERSTVPTLQLILSQTTTRIPIVPMSNKNLGTSMHSPKKDYILPVGIKTQPRPFESLKNNVSYSVELLPEESMLFDVKSQQTSTLHDSTNRNKSKTHAKYLTKILANNLRELLKREHEQPSGSQTNAISFDLIKLQNNIDEWIEQQYNSPKHRASTPTLKGRSKHIPIEYVEMLAATTMKTLQRQGKTFKNNGNKTTTQVHPLSISVNSLQSIYSIETTIATPHNERDEEYQYNSTKQNKANDTNEYSETERSIVNATNDSSFTFVTLQQTDNELWRDAAVTVLPETQEKLYVVTPQSKMFTKNSQTPLRIFEEVLFKPRFSIRPTIQSETRTEESQTHRTTDVFGLTGLTTYVHNRPVEIIDGNSKVVMIVTPSGYDNGTAATPTSPNIMDLTKIKHTTVRPTLSPTPR